VNPVDPAREKVERADAVVREFQEPVIDDPTVFVKSAALGALTLIELSKLAVAGTRSTAIRGFAERVRGSQGTVLAELTAIAGRKRLDVPKELIHQDEQMLKEAPEPSAAQFDSWYLRQVITEYLKSSTLYEAARNMKDPQLAAFAARTLPMLESDRQKASTLAIAAAREARP
jgi:predicted outer membrane protein